MKLKRSLIGPDQPGGPSRGRDVIAIKRGLSKYEDEFFTKPPAGFDDIYNRKTIDAVQTLRQIEGRRPLATPTFRQDDLDAIWPTMDAYARLMYRSFVVAKPLPGIPTLVNPLPRGSLGSVCQGLHATAGLPGNWAIDFCASSGTPVLAPEGGVIQRLSGHDPNEDTWDTLGVFGWTVYVRTDQGYVYFITHLGWRPAFIVDQRVRAGEIVGKIGDQKFRPDHSHVGVTSPLGEADAKRRILAVSTASRVKPVV